MTDANVLSEDKLFATLDPTTRSLALPSGEEILLTDTVGFIRKLPHNLIDAFRSTLEEAKYADIIVHVVDASNADRDKHMEIVYQTLADLGVENKTIITLFNKCDKLEETPILRDFKAKYIIPISAKQGDGIPEFEETLEKILKEDKIYIERVFDFAKAGSIQMIRKYGQLISEEYTAEGIEVKAYVPKEIYDKL